MSSGKKVIHVIATIRTVPGKRAEFIELFSSWLVPKVREEPGCIEYGPAIDVESGISIQDPLRENAVVIIEKWESLEALRVHLSVPHLTEWRTVSAGLSEGMTLQVLETARL
jgi:quinol monooxygenase YgiN